MVDHDLIMADFFGMNMTYPLVFVTNIAIENGHRNSGFSHWKWWFSIAMLVYQRVYINIYIWLVVENPSEKYWLVSWDGDIPNWMEK